MKQLLLIWLALASNPIFAGSSQIGGRTAPDGQEEIQCDLPGSQHLKNSAGRDGSGLCVFTSIEVSGRWQNVVALKGFQKKMQREPGGGWPEKVEAMLAKYAPGTHHLQYNGADPAILKLALKTGRMPAVTYGYSPRYGGRVAHMVNLVHLSERWAAVLDNNFPGVDRYEWMPPTEFFRRWQMNGGGWAVVLLAPPPPPIPIPAAKENPAMFAVVLLTGSFMPSSWVDCGPGPVGPILLSPDTAAINYEWRSLPHDADRIYLFQSGRQRGGYDYAGDFYRAYDADRDAWGEPTRPPIEPPARPLKNFGLARERLPQFQEGEECFRLDGRRIDRHRAVDALGQGPGLADDSDKLRLTVIGSEEECRRVTGDLESAPSLTEFRDHVLVQCYRPDDWAVETFKLDELGPTPFYLCVQRGPDSHGRGVVLHAQTHYDGPDDMASVLGEALRQADPSFHPRQVPDLRTPTPLIVPTKMRPLLVAGSLLVAVLLLVLIRKRV